MDRFSFPGFSWLCYFPPGKCLYVEQINLSEFHDFRNLTALESRNPGSNLKCEPGVVDFDYRPIHPVPIRPSGSFSVGGGLRVGKQILPLYLVPMLRVGKLPKTLCVRFPNLIIRNEIKGFMNNALITNTCRVIKSKSKIIFQIQ